MALVVLSTIAIAKEPRNLDNYKGELIRYHDTGDYMHDLDDVMVHALSYLQLRLEQPHKGQKFAIILDIDETSLSNYNNMRQMDFGGSVADVRRAEDTGTDPAILPTLQLYRYAKSHGIAVIFLTGRFEAERAVTAKNLIAAGYQNWDGLILRTKPYETVPAEVYKIAMRKQLVKQGYRIILNIGDQKSDLLGGYADKTFKLANPYYYIA